MPHGYRPPFRKHPLGRTPPGHISRTLHGAPSPPPNPANRFLLLEYAHAWIGAILYIACTSDIACHMFLRWTAKPIGMHNRATDLGGFGFMTDPKYCFVEYNEVEQNEPGDTLSHTFNFGGWATCEWRWWLMVATVGGAPSPSATCIFQAHYLDQEEAVSLKHTDLVAKEVAGVIDHADDSITVAKLAHNIDATGIGFDADKLDGKHAADIGGGYKFLYEDLGRFHEFQGRSIDGFRQAITAPGSITLDWYELRLLSGAAVTGHAQIGKYLYDLDQVFSWEKVRRLKGLVQWSHVLGERSYFIMGWDRAHEHIGFWLEHDELYATWKSNGGLNTWLLMTVAAMTRYKLEVVYILGDGAYFYVDDVFKYKATSGLPGGSDYAQYFWTAYIYSVGGGNYRMSVYHVKSLQEP